MSLRENILAEKGTGTLTYKQGKLLYQLTMLKWWQPEQMPAPTIKQASLLIDACLAYNKARTREGGRELLDAIQIWFPSFDISEIHSRYFAKDHEKGNEPESEPEAKAKGGKGSKAPAPDETPQKRSHHKKPAGDLPQKRSHHKKPAPRPEPEPEPERKAPEKRHAPVPDEELNDTVRAIKARIKAGVKNLWLVGPAGCGKTTICKEVGEALDMPVTIIPCGLGTTATTFLGYSYPTREATPFVLAYQQEGIIVLDEFTALEAQVAQIPNSALGNNELSSKVGTCKRHPQCIIIATSNTFGNGADRMYIANNQLDASTNDRFIGGVLELDYSKEYESQFDNEVTRYVWGMRETIRKNGLRKLASTRAIIVGCDLKKAGENWKSALITSWSKDEKALLQ